MEGPPLTFYFAEEIELSVVSFLFREPERITDVYRELDPQTHILQPHLRHVLEAQLIAYREEGVPTFADVVRILRELGHLESVGGISGVAEIYDYRRFGASQPQIVDRIFSHWLEMLKNYAVARESKQPFFYSNRGLCELVENKAKRSDSGPDVTGTAQVCGRYYSALGWYEFNRSEQKVLRVSLTPKA